MKASENMGTFLKIKMNKNMTQEDKQLLIKDICARLPYRINVLTEDNDKGYIVGVDDTENGVFEIHIIEDGDSYTCDESIENFKPYLRSLSSMTEEEFLTLQDMYVYKNLEYESIIDKFYTLWKSKKYIPFYMYDFRQIDYLNSHYLDYRGLIEKGLALEAPEEMYKV